MNSVLDLIQKFPGIYHPLDFIKPIGLNKTQWVTYKTRQKNLLKEKKYAYQRGIERSKVYQRRKRLEERVKKMWEPCFITITLNEESIKLTEKQRRHSINRALKRRDIIDFVYAEDYGKKTNRLHYHGVVDIYKSNWKKESTKYKGHKNGRKRYQDNEFVVGSINFETISDEKKAIDYVVKYTLKDGKAPKMTYSTKQVKVNMVNLAIEMFGNASISRVDNEIILVYNRKCS